MTSNSKDATLFERLGQVRLAYAVHDTHNANQAVMEILAEQPALEPYLRGLAAWGAEAYEDAIGFFREASDVAETPAEVIELLAWSLLETGAVEDAKRLLEQRLLVAPDSNDALVGLARCHFRLRNPEDARGLIDQVIAEDPEHFEAWYGRGVSELALGQVEVALEALQRANELAPLNPRPYRAIARIMKMMGDFAGCARFLEEALRNPTLRSAELLMEYADILVVADQPDKLRELLAEVRSSLRFAPGPWNELGRYYYGLGDGDEVRALATAVVEADEEREVPREDLAEAYYLLALAALFEDASAGEDGGDADPEVDPGEEEAAAPGDGGAAAAEAYLSQARALDPGNWRCRATLSGLLLDMGAREEAAEVLTEAEALAPMRGEVRFNRALWHALSEQDDLEGKDGHKEKACEILEPMQEDERVSPNLRSRATELLTILQAKD